MSHEPHERHPELYAAEYAKQLERIARIRSSVSAALDGPPRPAPPPPPAPAPAPAPTSRWDATPRNLSPLAAPPARRPRPVVPPRESFTRHGWQAPVAHDERAHTPSERPGRPRRRRWTVAGLLATALTACGVTVAIVAQGADVPLAGTTFTLPGRPTGVAVAGDRVWLAGADAGVAWVLDARTGRAAGPALRAGGTPARLVVTDRWIWLADTQHAAVLRAGRRAGAQVHTWGDAPDVADVAVAADAVWVASSADGTIRVRSTSARADDRGAMADGGATSARGAGADDRGDGPDRSGGSRGADGWRVLPVGARPVALAADARHVVAADAGAGALVRLSAPGRRALGEPIRLGGTPADVALRGTEAWIVDAAAGTLQRADVVLGTAAPAAPVCPVPVAVAADDRAVYVLCRGDRTLVRIDPSAGRVVARVRLAYPPTALALGPRHVWIAAGAREVIRVDR